MPVTGGAGFSSVLMTTEESLEIDSEEIVRLSGAESLEEESKLSVCGEL